MVLEIDSFRPQEDPAALGPEQIRENQRKRFKDVELVQKITDADAAWRKAQFNSDAVNRLRNVASNLNKTKRAAGEKENETDKLPEDLPAEIYTLDSARLSTFTLKQLSLFVHLLKEAEGSLKTLAEEQDKLRNELLRGVGNILHDSVPISDNEDNNGIVRMVGKSGNDYRMKYSHVDLAYMIGGVDTKRGTKVAGSRCYFLKGPGVALEQALVQYALQLLQKAKYTALSPPVFMAQEVMAEVAQLSQFDDELYKVTCKASEQTDDATVVTKYLIATAEQPIAAFHRDEWLDPKELPLRYVGISECFRQEVGSHGRDTGGIFRVHQFKKIEQFCITSPSKSWEMLDEMINHSEEFCQSLGFSYRIVNIVSGALNLAAAKKFDLEAWFPGSGAFRELVSCSNCTDYQSRRLKIRYGQTKAMNQRAELVHMLNSTMCATTRVICCILENYQVGDYSEDAANNGGVVVPEILRPFMPEQYREFIPFVAPAPIEEEAEKAKEKGKSKAAGAGAAGAGAGAAKTKEAAKKK